MSSGRFQLLRYRATRFLDPMVPLVVLGALVSTACGATSGEVGARVVPSVGPPGPAITYVAIGASESVGYGAENPATQAWTQVLYRGFLPRASVFVDLGIPGATVAQALDEEVPQAVGLHPDLVTVWLNANDLIHRVPVATYETELGTLLADLRQAGTKWILVANTPPLALLPGYRACQPYLPTPEGGCDMSQRLPPEEVDRTVAAYNAAIARAAEAESAVVVDLHTAISAVPGADMPTLVSSDGFHPSAAGYRLIGEVFGAAFRRLWSKAGSDLQG
jgi:acyl-CoA thioesterase I